jgi:hypothetical protein
MRERKLYERPSNKKARFGRVSIFPRPFRPDFARKWAILSPIRPYVSTGGPSGALQHGQVAAQRAMENRDSHPHFGAEAAVT